MACDRLLASAGNDKPTPISLQNRHDGAKPNAVCSSDAERTQELASETPATHAAIARGQR